MSVFCYDFFFKSGHRWAEYNPFANNSEKHNGQLDIPGWFSSRHVKRVYGCHETRAILPRKGWKSNSCKPQVGYFIRLSSPGLGLSNVGMETHQQWGSVTLVGQMPCCWVTPWRDGAVYELGWGGTLNTKQGQKPATRDQCVPLPGT